MALGLLSFGVGAAQAVVQYSAQRKMASQNATSAEKSWKINQEQITRRELQEADALAQKQREQNLAEAEAQSETAVSAAAAGISGISVDNLMADVSRRAATNRQTAQDNTDMLVSQLKLQRKGVNAQAQSQINSVASPSPLSLIAGIGSAGVSGFNSYVGAKNRMT
jgi:hypothetical protein